MTNIRKSGQSRTATARRAALGLMTALAVTLGGVAAPLAATAHAGGAAGGIVGTITSRNAGLTGAGSTGEEIPSHAPSVAGGNGGISGGDLYRVAGSKPGGMTDGALIVNGADSEGRKPGASGGSDWTPRPPALPYR
jgi:hypothetical protein